MSDDVTIPCEMAADIAKALRNVAESWKPLGHTHAVDQVREWADLLDPPQSNLRDKVASELGDTSWAGETADRVLAVVRKHYRELIENLSSSDVVWDGYTPEEAYDQGIRDVLDVLAD